MTFRVFGKGLLLPPVALHAVLSAGCCDVTRIHPEVLPEAVVGRPYSIELEHDCEGKLTEEDIRWSVSEGLPAGMRLSGSELSGTPTAAGTFRFIVSLSNRAAFAGTSTFFSQDYTLTVRAVP